MNDDRPLHLLAITGLTLPDLPEADRARITEAAGPGATLSVVGRVRDAVPARVTGVFLLVLAAGFGWLWLGQIVPALLSGTDPAGLSEDGVFTNPVHVLDLSLLLPAVALTGISLLRRRVLGLALAPLMLSYTVFMSLATGGMAVVMEARGMGWGPGLAMVTTGIALVSAALLVASLGQVDDRRPEVAR